MKSYGQKILIFSSKYKKLKFLSTIFFIFGQNFLNIFLIFKKFEITPFTFHVRNTSFEKLYTAVMCFDRSTLCTLQHQ